MRRALITSHHDVLDHLLDPACATLGVIPAALAGHDPPGSEASDLSIDRLSPCPVWTHPADPDRLLVGVDTDHGPTVVALDHIVHLHYDHPVCGPSSTSGCANSPRSPSEATLFALQTIPTSWSADPLAYVVHIDDHLAAADAGWPGVLTDHTELSWLD
ncbi:hypothetical protein [Nocardia farcinica]|uniref:hypothetical protein n=1 Tax=Nocardia farcinica TaxID=37329 RepID=UPI002457FF3B|nr:hypothetical protein [Nocardia farcinica]